MAEIVDINISGVEEVLLNVDKTDNNFLINIIESSGGEGVSDHALLQHLTYDTSGHIGFASSTDLLALSNELDNKVDKEAGKSLSSNDYTTTDKNKLAGIQVGAEVNVNADWNSTSGDSQILNKPTIPNKTSDLTNDSGFISTETDPIFVASPAHSITTQNISTWNSKQNALGYTPVTDVRTLTLNGVTYDLTANRTWIVGDILSTSSYSNPSWITTLAWSKISGAPSFITSAAISTLTDVLLTSLTSGNLLKYNGTKWINTLLSSSDIPNLDMSKITTGNLSWSRISSTPTTLLGYGISYADTLFDNKYQATLPPTPVDPSKMYLNGNLQWAEIAIGSGGNASNIYFSLVNSDVSGYRTLTYTPDSTETQYSNSVTNTESLFITYLGPLQIGVTVINAGTWSFSSYIEVDKTTGTTQLKYEPFVRHLDGSETTLFSVYSDQITNTTFKQYTTATTQNAFTVVSTDRLGIRVYGKTTSSAAVIITRIVGDGRGAYFTTSLPLRHTQLRSLNDDINNQHVTTTQISGWNHPSQLYQPNATNPFVYTDNSGQLHIDGNIIQNGSSYETHAEKLYTQKDLIYTRDGATSALGSGSYTGIQAIKYDGVNDGQLVFDNNGIARVGDVGNTQPITTRIETPIDGNFAYWDSTNTRLNFRTLTKSDVGLSNVENTALSTWSGSSNITTLGTIGTGVWHGSAIADTYISSANNWNTAYTNRITSLTTTGNTGAATLSSNTLNIPNYTLAGLGGQPLLNGGTGFVKSTAGIISYDNSSYLPVSGGAMASGTGIDNPNDNHGYSAIGFNDNHNALGSPTFPTKLRSSINPTVVVGSTEYTLYHSGNLLPGTTSGTFCSGDDSRLSNARPASDVYVWAKSSTKPAYTFSEITGEVNNILAITGASNPYIRISKTNATARYWLIQASDDKMGIGSTFSSSLQIDPYGNTSVPSNLSCVSATITGGSPSAGKVLTATDANGNCTWQTPAYLPLTGGTLTGSVTATNFILSSDIRLKENISKLNAKGLPINYYSYNFKSDTTHSKRFGVIAQELEKVAPELVNTDNEGMKSVNYIDLLVREVAYLKNKVKELERRLK